MKQSAAKESGNTARVHLVQSDPQAQAENWSYAKELRTLGQALESHQLGTVELDERSPHLLNYSGNLVLSAPTGTSVVPYVTGGIGGLTLFERRPLTVDQNETFFTSNVGGGLNWYAGRWGLRGDYRFIAVQSKDDAPVFFGRENRYGHRVYGGVLLNIGR